MTETISKDELAELVNQDLGPSKWFPIDQDRIDTFADCSDDHQFIHVDPDAAGKTPFGGTIAHGFLTLSLLTALCAGLMPRVEKTAMGINYGLDKVRFLAPVKAGARVRAHARLLETEEKNPGQILCKYQVTIEIEGEEKPALVAEWLVMVVTA